MRDILFRGKCNGVWVYGGYAYCQELGHAIVTEKNLYPVEEETVGEYTGLHDKNDKMIFEGDIIKGLIYGECFVGTVEYYDEIATFIARAEENNASEYLCGFDDTPEVIGNKWDGVKE